MGDATAVNAMEEVARGFGKIDILVNNAAWTQAPALRVQTISVERWFRMHQVSLRSAFLCMRAVAPLMRANGGGRHAVLDGEQCVCIQKVDAPGLIKIDTYIDRRMDLHCTAVAKVVLAFGPEDALQRILAKQVCIRHTRNTITSPKLLQREVQRIRKLGYAVDYEEEEPGVRCVPVPV